MSDHLNPLERSPSARQRVYDVFWVAGLLLGSLWVGFQTVGDTVPGWVSVAMAVYLYVGAAVGFTARQNVTFPSDK